MPSAADLSGTTLVWRARTTVDEHAKGVLALERFEQRVERRQLEQKTAQVLFEREHAVFVLREDRCILLGRARWRRWRRRLFDDKVQRVSLDGGAAVVLANLVACAHTRLSKSARVTFKLTIHQLAVALVDHFVNVVVEQRAAALRNGDVVQAALLKQLTRIDATKVEHAVHGGRQKDAKVVDKLEERLVRGVAGKRGKTVSQCELVRWGWCSIVAVDFSIGVTMHRS